MTSDEVTNEINVFFINIGYRLNLHEAVFFWSQSNHLPGVSLGRILKLDPLKPSIQSYK